VNISDLGESGLIARLKTILPTASPDLLIGIGDDCAAIKLDDNRLLLATCDIQVEGEHFHRYYFTPYQIGRRALAVNLSDIAAMGGKPTFVFISLGLPPDLPTEDFDDLQRGIADIANEFGVIVAGGNLSRSPAGLIVDIFLLGETTSDRLLTRSGARPGDRVFVTGHLGASIAGLRLLQAIHANPDKSELAPRSSQLVTAHTQPTPRIAAGQAIAASGWATAMIDISDGLAADLGHLCEQSGVGAEIRQTSLPIPPELPEVAAAWGVSPLDLALYGGEDYELLFILKPDTSDAVIAAINESAGVTITEIGRILPKEDGCRLLSDSVARIPLPPRGWDHFSSPPYEVGGGVRGELKEDSRNP
jgi:thiamine-monophosphate kinase